MPISPATTPAPFSGTQSGQIVMRKVDGWQSLAATSRQAH